MGRTPNPKSLPTAVYLTGIDERTYRKICREWERIRLSGKRATLSAAVMSLIARAPED